VRTNSLVPQRVAVVLNPIKLQADEARDAVILACRKGGWSDPEFYLTEVDDSGYSMARRAVEDGADVVLAAGGDGTVRAVAETLAGTDTALGLVPLGTGNLLARNLGANLADPRQCVDVALFGSEKSIDTVSFNLEREDGTTDKNRFLVMGGGGFDAQIMADTKDDLKDMVGWIAYGEAGARHLFNRPGWARFRVDGGEWESARSRSVMVCNCGELTGGMVLVPDAKLDDGVLDLVVMSPRSMLGWARMAAKVLLRQTHDLPVIDFHRGKHVRAEFWDATESQIDGDSLGKITAFESEVFPSSLRVRVAPSMADLDEPEAPVINAADPDKI